MIDAHKRIFSLIKVICVLYGMLSRQLKGESCKNQILMDDRTQSFISFTCTKQMSEPNEATIINE